MKLYKVTCYKLGKTYPILSTRYCKKKKKIIALSMIKQEKKGIYMQMTEWQRWIYTQADTICCTI